MAHSSPPSLASTLLWMLLGLLASSLYTRGEVYIVRTDGTPASEKFSVRKHNGPVPSISPSVAAQAYSAQLAVQHDELLKNAFAPTSYKKLYSYTHLFSGFAVQVPSDQADTLRRLPGVKWLEEDWKLEQMTTHTPEFLGLPQGLWSMDGGPSGAGGGVVIGIIDTGIDPTHPSFSVPGSTAPYPPLPGFHGNCEETSGVDGTFCNGKIVAAQHFSAAAEAAGVFNSSSDNSSPLDGDGHGSHIASIAAGNQGVPVLCDGFYFGEASGMAPQARLSIYKALYKQFGGFVSDVVAAIDQAAKDGVNVLNLSVGPSSPPSSTRTAFLNAFDVALLSAVRAGVFVVQAAGNGGPYPKTMTSFSPWIMSVAAGIDDRHFEKWIILGNGGKLSGGGLAPATPGDQMYDLVLAEDAIANGSGNTFNPTSCQKAEPFNRTLVQGKILMCTYSFSFLYGGSTVQRVVDTARNLSAAGFVLFTKSELPGNKFNPLPMSIPGIVITDVQDSFSLLGYYNNSVVRDTMGHISAFGAQAKIGDGLSPKFQGAAPQVALYSSRGPGVKDFSMKDADILKPNILAPGSSIWAAWSSTGTDEPNFQGQSFAMMSGTSMATPHVAGIAALLKQRHPDWTPAAIASAMMTTASFSDNQGSPLLAQHLSEEGAITMNPATPFDVGSGAINATAAVDPGLIFDAGYQNYIDFLCSVSEADHIQVLNVTGSECSSKAGVPADLNLPSVTLSNLVDMRTVARTVTNVGGAAETYVASYVAPTGVSMQVAPPSFTVQAGASATFSITLRPAAAPSLDGQYSFGALFLRGDRAHHVRVPLAVRVGTA